MLKSFLILAWRELPEKAAVEAIIGSLVGIAQDAGVEYLYQVGDQHEGRGFFAWGFLAVVNGVVAVDRESSTCHQGHTYKEYVLRFRGWDLKCATLDIKRLASLCTSG